MAVTSITNNCHVWSCLNLKKNFLSRSYSLSFYAHARATISLLSHTTFHATATLYTILNLTLFSHTLHIHATATLYTILNLTLILYVHAKATILNHLSHSIYTFMLQLHYTLYSTSLSYSMFMLKLLYSTISHTLYTRSCYSYTIHYTQPHSHTLCSC